MNRRSNLFFRLAVASCVGIVVAALAIAVAWQNAREAPMMRRAQWWTQRNLRGIEQAITRYQQESNALPCSLSQLMGMESDIHFENNGEILDGWKRPFVCSTDGTNFLVTSYGRDGKPGGKGLDCDLTNRNRSPKESLPTFLQFVCDLPSGGMIGTCFVCGAIAFFLSLYAVKTPDLTPHGLAALGFKLGATIIGAVIVAVIISALHIPSGH